MERSARPGDFVVDLGCGSGRTVHRLTERGVRAMGIDENDDAFAYPDLQLVKASIYNLPVDSGVVDLAYSRWVFEHLEDPRRAIAEMCRILKPDGLALVVTPNVMHPGVLLSKVLPFGTKQSMLARLNNIRPQTVFKTYYHANTRRTLTRLFVEQGFDTVEFHFARDPSYWIFSRTFFKVANVADRLHAIPPMDMVALFRKRAS
jgi:ubiquinone/menaquinone biosynthesis C-methylase UbiE